MYVCVHLVAIVAIVPSCLEMKESSSFTHVAAIGDKKCVNNRSRKGYVRVVGVYVVRGAQNSEWCF